MSATDHKILLDICIRLNRRTIEKIFSFIRNMFWHMVLGAESPQKKIEKQQFGAIKLRNGAIIIPYINFLRKREQGVSPTNVFIRNRNSFITIAPDSFI